ncbi:MAG: prolyl oligopeptidase family serine peptidase [Sediminicola sp.]
MKKIITVIIYIQGSLSLFAQQGKEVLTVEKIMSDTVYVGEVPSNIRWNADSRTVYFDWRPMDGPKYEVYGLSMEDPIPIPVTSALEQEIKTGDLSFSRDRKKILFERDGDIFIKDLPSETETALLQTSERESRPVFDRSENSVIFQKGQNLYSISVLGKGLGQLTNFTARPTKEGALNEQDKWLQQDQLAIFDILKKQKGSKAAAKEGPATLPKEYFFPGSASLTGISADPTMRFVVFTLQEQAAESRNIIVPNYVTVSGYTEDIPGRTKVGSQVPTYRTKIYDRERDTVYDVATANIPDIKRLPEYLKEYPDLLEERTRENADREVSIGQPIWHPNATVAIVNVMSSDNKDRWIMKLDPVNGHLSLLDHQHDEAWIGGPGVGRRYRSPEVGWLDKDVIYFQSEVTGYSHLYTMDIANGQKKQLTSGNYEVQTLQLSKDGKWFYFTANMEHPGITHFYRMPVGGGTPVQLTSMKGGNEVSMSPDEKWLAIRHSTTTRPWELFLQENKPGASAKKITKTISADFEAYPWKVPETITYKNRHGTDIYAQVFQPTKPLPNRPAVVFVHSNGYLQNVHYWWSYHFREYMFNNLLVDKGFTVINIDYTASSGYGREIRTGIYRHMGGKDLSDLTDGAKLLVDKYGVDPDNIGLYGGSYGGFLTLMGLFTEPEVFKSGAALRSVTDWAHYNQGYTSNILNTPLTDEMAYKRSSPIYFASGLKGHLLMTHGIVDVNVNFQDIVRLSQRLIELGKDHWELAVYPLEDHNFVEPSSWTDQYKRILRLFEETLTGTYQTLEPNQN